MACRDDEASLDGPISLAIRLDNLLRDRKGNISHIEIGNTHRTRWKAKLRRERRYFYCGSNDHLLSQCREWAKPKAPRNPQRTALLTFIPFKWSSYVFTITFFIASRTESLRSVICGFSYDRFGICWKLPRQTFFQQELANTSDWTPQSSKDIFDRKGAIGTRTITRCTPMVGLSMSGLHTERICFLIINTPSHKMILGIPWLSLHNPRISWDKHKITEWWLSSYLVPYLHEVAFIRCPTRNNRWWRTMSKWL